MTSIFFISTTTIFILTISGILCQDENLIAKTNCGKIQGVTDTSRNGRSFVKFLGIPYARPPIGNLRFKPPQRLKPWTETRMATIDASECIQTNYLFDGNPISGSEDCLYMNVYTHKVNQNESNETLKPVMVYIHGGGWFAGSGSSIVNGPEFFMDHDVVVVVPNYRLGVFGFFSTGDDVATGNWGQKDQLAVLRWVQENIKHFNGNPDNVTLFGQSAGAASIHYHVLSPKGKGLFHRAILQSGSALALWAQPMDAKKVAADQAEFVNCTNTNTSEMFKCLQKVDAVELLKSADNFKFWSVDPLDVYSVTIEKKTPLNPHPYITENPYQTLRQKKVGNPVPLIIGIVPEEANIRGAKITFTPALRDDLNSQFEELGPKLLEVQKSVPESEVGNLFRNMTEFYMNGEMELNENTEYGFLKMYSDRAIIYSTYQTALLHIEAGHDVYFYRFNFSGIYSFTPLLAGGITNGVGHCDDLIYLFRTAVFFPDLPADHPNVYMSNKLVKLWANFAIHGNPTPDNETLNDVVWQQLPKITDRCASNSDLNFLSIQNSDDVNAPVEFKMDNGLFTDRMRFWEESNILQNEV